MYDEGNEQNHNKKQAETTEDKKDNKNKCRRTKERKIGYIIEKVVEWRNLYNGFSDPENK